MDLSQASQAHADWKVKLRMAIAKKEQMDLAVVSADNCCLLGKWLHGDGKARYGHMKTYGDCLRKHADFHKAAGAVAQVINAGQYDKATQMLDAGTPYAAATTSVGAAILGLKKEAAL